MLVNLLAINWALKLPNGNEVNEEMIGKNNVPFTGLVGILGEHQDRWGNWLSEFTIGRIAVTVITGVRTSAAAVDIKIISSDSTYFVDNVRVTKYRS